MKRIFRKIRDSRFKYNPLVSVHIHKDHLLHNYNYYKTHFPDLMIAPVLKSNAYGHGLVEVANILDSKNIPFLVVDTYYEALILRNEGIKKPILIIGFTSVDTIVSNNLKNVSFTIIDEDVDLLVNKVNKPVDVHLKFDTGMHRQGLSLHDKSPIVPRLPKQESGGQARGTINKLLSNNNIQISGICSHLADADNTSSELTKLQIRAWNQLVNKMSSILPNIKYYHLSATGGINNVPRGTIHEKTNTVRLGIGLYGLGSIYSKLKPVMSVHTIITSIRNIQKGDSVGYEGSFTADKTMKIATIPMGYNEGIDRKLSNKGYVKIVLCGTMCPIVGKVSMNITSIDVTDVEDLRVGDEVEVISCDHSNKNSVMNIAKTSEAITYEILVHINQKLRRKCV